jgi:uncharacterized protein YukE
MKLQSMITLLGAALVTAALPTAAQQTGGALTDRGNWMPPPPPPVNLPEGVIALRTEMQTLRTELAASRAELLASLAGVTREEFAAAMEAWSLENADKFEAVKDIAETIRDIMQDFVPERPTPPVIPQEVLDLRAALHDVRVALGDSRKEAIDGLTDPADIRAAIEAWREVNADAIAAMEALAAELRTAMEAIRPVHTPRPLPQVNAALAQLREQVRTNHEAMKTIRQQLNAGLQAATTPEERQAAIRDFREAQRTYMQQLKELKRQNRVGDGDISGGERRPGG